MILGKLRERLPAEFKDGVLRLLKRGRLSLLPRRTIPLNRILLGDEGGIPADRYARMLDAPMRPSTPIEQWPHVALLQLFDESGETILSPSRFFETDYAKNALLCLDVLGHYFQAHSEEGIIRVARDFLERYQRSGARAAQAAVETQHGHSERHAPILVRPIRFSDCYQMIDGHHRAAIAWARGERTIRAAVVRPTVLTPLQSLLLDVTWANGPRELYQPIDAPEVMAGWRLVRQCKDRMEKMSGFLHEQGITPCPGVTYADIACNYGWFVRGMSKIGYEAYGVERDPTACRLASLVNGVDPSRIFRSDVVRFLKADPRQYDIVSCLSLLHHFVLNRYAIDASTLIRLLDSITGRVLFLDTGQSHEKWFCDRLPEWDAGYIEQWLLKNTSFTRVFQLGADCDDAPPYAGNYGRMLFACMR